MANVLIKENKVTFPNGNNIRIAITGLAICDFNNPKSYIEFLRHVEKHKLKIKIVQKNSDDLSIVGSTEHEIGKDIKSISISGAERIASSVYKPTRYEEYDLDNIISFKKLHGHELVKNNKPSKPITPPTILTIENCAFYTNKLTDKKYNLIKFDTDSGTATPIYLEKNFCEVLGGYMTCKNELLPIEIDKKNYVYEIYFHNACFKEDGSVCNESEIRENNEQSKDKTDFAEYYELLLDDVKPSETYDLNESGLGLKGLGTGACLPGCTKC
jgi:hypothetical protein